MQDNGIMENNTGKAYSQQLLAWKDKGIGRMERGLVGQIMNDFM